MDKQVISEFDIECVRKFNGCLNLFRLRRVMRNSQWNRFAELLEQGKLCFSGDPSGLHIRTGESSVMDCADPLTSLVVCDGECPGYPPVAKEFRDSDDDGSVGHVAVGPSDEG